MTLLRVSHETKGIASNGYNQNTLSDEVTVAQFKKISPPSQTSVFLDVSVLQPTLANNSQLSFFLFKPSFCLKENVIIRSRKQTITPLSPFFSVRTFYFSFSVFSLYSMHNLRTLTCSFSSILCFKNTTSKILPKL